MKSKMLLKVLCIAFLLSISSCNQHADEGTKTVNIACNLPLTGDVSAYGVTVRDGILFAVEDMKSGGLLDSINLKFDIQDNKSSNADAVAILNKQLLDSPKVYIEGLDHQTSAMIDKITETGVPHFTYSWEPFICKRGVNNFRTGINLEQESDYYVKFIEYKKPKKLSIIHINDPGSFLQFDSLVIPRAKQVGVSDIKVEIFDFETSDFKTIASKVKAYAPDAIIVAGYDIHHVPLIKDFRNYGLIKGDNMMCSVDLLDAAANLSPDKLEGIRFTCPQFVYNSSSELDAWKKRFESKFNRKAKYSDAYAYDMTYLIYEAAKKAKDNYSYSNLVEIIRGTDMNGITGKLVFNPNRDISLNLDVCFYQGGNIVKANY